MMEKKQVSLRPAAFVSFFIILVFALVALLMGENLAAVLDFIAALIIFPPVGDIIAKRFKKNIDRGVRILLSLVFIILAFVAISNSDKQTVAQEQKDAEIQQQVDAADLAAWQSTPAGKLCQKHPSWSRDACDSLINGDLAVGMTVDEATYLWGKPDHVNTTTTVNGTVEQWVYGMTKYLYFTDGVLTAIQN